MVLFYPPESSSNISLEELCEQAVQSNQPILLTQNVVLTEGIRLKGQQKLVLRGQTSSQEKVIVSGSVFSLFLLNNHSHLDLQDIHLRHTLQTDDHKDVGATVQLRSKATLTASSSTFYSASGFCTWSVQKCNVHLQHCLLQAPARSACVCFGQSNCILDDTILEDAGVHALCGRGTVQLTLRNCRITNCAARAIYAYAGATLCIENCMIEGTSHPAKAAIEVASSTQADAGETGNATNNSTSTFTIADTQVVDNAGVAICLRGPVKYHTHGHNVLERNGRGDWEIFTTDGPGNDAVKVENSIRRDESGSSFRRGDWCCLNCDSLQVGRNETCSKCQATQAARGHLLTMNEIGLLNRGIDYRLPQNDSPVIPWYFDGDDKGWIRYDGTTSRCLEERFQAVRNNQNPPGILLPATVVLPNNPNYCVDVRSMEQVNQRTQFLRLVKREEGEAGNM
eukprot:Nitzschia sp. Nitz4//scaffold12_size214221//156006//157364//NITZ4_001521-RA/size214221-processed-gene-0.173-mRNA-1//-1//CDS//3329535083//8468//frame0